ncbi:uncharacterized protein LOC111674606 [Lucilia cuprina]|uniref:uncharacterized protein LOC111674606 n=1 Tax=Lucilia cuprina TaxID=7375 RepID=UPI001F06160F|nr:uncharacterized protein LOC111674606 [Lucilia cuprina]
MKNLVIIVIFLAFANADIENTSFNGRPGCKTLGEVGLTFPNFFDSSRYWHCYAINNQAISERCPNQYGFQASIKSCVPYTVWRWEEPVMPPSCPDFEQECIAGSSLIVGNNKI